MVHIHKLRDSFKYAWRGMKVIFRDEQNFRIQLVAGILAILAALFFGLPTWKMVAILMMIAFVLILELINSVFERIVDVFKPRIHQYVEEMKDIMAAAVLLVSVGAAVIGVILFWPHVF